MADAIRVVEDNVEATEAWNGPLFDVWIEYRDIVAEGVREHGEAALAAEPPREGDRVLDIGCGLGDTTVRLAGLVGPTGHAHGVDVAERMIATAIEEAADAGLENVSFATCDVEQTSFDRTFDYAFSRMGTMFFANPVAALRNVREALAPGGVLNMVVWRRKLDNEFMHRAELVVAEYLDEPEESDAPRCGPGPFSMANADTVSDVLTHAGFTDIRLARQDLPYKIGDDLEHAVAFNMALGPAAEVLRMWGERVDEIKPKIADDLREALARYVVDGGAVVAPASTWAVTARAMSQEKAPRGKRERADAMTAAVNRRDSDAVAELVDPEVELRSVLAGVEGGVYTGAEGLSAWVEDLHATWDDYRGEIVEFHEVGDDQTIVVFRVGGRAKESGVPLDARIAQVWTWRNEKPWRAVAYSNPREAFEAAGLRE